MSTLLKVSAPIDERIVQVSSSEGFAVRGLNPMQVGAIYKRHAGQLEPLFQGVLAGIQAGGGVAGADIQPLFLSLISECPVLMAELIAVGSGGDPAALADITITHPGTREPATLATFDAAVLVAQHLPFPVQVDALAKIGELTFTSEMPVGKFLALVLGLLRKAAGALEMAASRQPPLNGSGASVDPSVS